VGQKVITDVYDKMTKDAVRTRLILLVYKLIAPKMVYFLGDYDSENFN
jgi:hypothetical protein